mgnify:CR=1 FL=1
MANILITGGAGFIPSSLAESLVNIGHKVVLADNLVTGKLSNIPKADNCEFYECDVNQYQSIANIMNKIKFDYVFHYAALVGVQRTQEYPVKVLKDIEGFKHVLNLCKSTGVKRVFFSSSSAACRILFFKSLLDIAIKVHGCK